MAKAPPGPVSVADQAQIMYMMGPCILGWSALYIVTRFLFFRKYSADFSNRVVSIVHAVLLFVLAAMVQDWSDLLGNVGGNSTVDQVKVMALSLSYFIYDLICCLLIEIDLPGALHHFATIAGLAVGVLKGVNGTELTLCLMMMEASNPMMHLRVVFKDLGWKDKTFAIYNDLLFAAVFFVCRIIFGPPLVWKTAVGPSDPLVKFGAVGIQVVSLFWFWKIAQVALYKAKKLSPKSTNVKKAE